MKANHHFAFTLNLLLINKIHASGEEVKAKNEKRRTRAHARKSLNLRMRKKEWGLFNHFQKKSRLSMQDKGINRKCTATNTTMNGLRLPFGVVYAILLMKTTRMTQSKLPLILHHVDREAAHFDSTTLPVGECNSEDDRFALRIAARRNGSTVAEA